MRRKIEREPAQAKGRPHPSGRPIRQERVIGRGFWNIPGDGPMTPRLRREGLAEAVGFHAHIVPPDDNDRA